jgi:hypothetical protein
MTPVAIFRSIDEYDPREVTSRVVLHGDKPFGTHRLLDLYQMEKKIKGEKKKEKNTVKYLAMDLNFLSKETRSNPRQSITAEGTQDSPQSSFPVNPLLRDIELWHTHNNIENPPRSQSASSIILTADGGWPGQTKAVDIDQVWKENQKKRQAERLRYRILSLQGHH